MGDDVMENKKIDFKTFVIYGGGLLTILAALAGIFLYLNATFVSKEVYNIHIQQNVEDMKRAARDMTELEDKTARLIEAIENERTRDRNEMMKAIKDGSALPLVVRRDILLARGNLSQEDRAELNVLNQKLQELNVGDN